MQPKVEHVSKISSRRSNLKQILERQASSERKHMEIRSRLHLQMKKISFGVPSRKDKIWNSKTPKIDLPLMCRHTDTKTKRNTVRILHKITRRGHSSFDFCWMVRLWSLWSSIMCINLNNKRTLSRRIVDSIPLRNQQINDASKNKEKNNKSSEERKVWGRKRWLWNSNFFFCVFPSWMNETRPTRDLNSLGHNFTQIPPEIISRWRQLCARWFMFEHENEARYQL